MTVDVINLLFFEKQEEIDRNFQKLSQLLGIRCEVMQLDDYLRLCRKQPDVKGCVALSCHTLQLILYTLISIEEFKTIFFTRATSIFLFGISPGSKQSEVLNWITSGTVREVASFDNSSHQYQVGSSTPEICSVFSGYTFGPIQNDIDFYLSFGAYDSGGVQELISIDGVPFFVSIKSGSTRLFLLACRDVIDIEFSLYKCLSLVDYFSKFIPIVMFLRHMFGDKCWQASGNFGCVIIDDPLLKPKYGFLNYSQLLQAMDEYNFFTEVAFIPWNYKRSDETTVRLLKERSDRFAICVHGYDHTGGEFGKRNFDELYERACLAKVKMQLHEKLTGLPFDPVMVFPQGKFSTEAMRALKHSGYLAAANTDIVPTEYVESDAIQIGDLTQPALMNYEDFPLYTRRYPIEPLDFLLDLFLGKPALIVIHHADFKDGFERITNLISQLNAACKDIVWCNMGNISRRSYLWRRDGIDSINIRMYACSCMIEGKEVYPTNYTVTKSERDKMKISAQVSYGESVPLTSKDDVVTMRFQTRVGQATTINLTFDSNTAECGDRFIARRQFNAGLRRYFSEFRDNYIARYKPLSIILDDIRKILRR